MRHAENEPGIEHTALTRHRADAAALAAGKAIMEPCRFSI
jgi:hypothetical protein